MFGFTLVALCATGCFAEDDDDAQSPLSGSGGSAGQNDGPSANAGTAGSSGGTAAANGGTAGSGGSAGSSADDTGGTGGTADAPDSGEPPAASGETGLFVGATAAHNAIRDELDEDLPDLTWSDALSVVAQDWADTLTREQCGSIGHRPNGRYGENIAARGSKGISLDPMPPEDAVQGWADEVACWTYGKITGGNTGVQGGEQCDATCIASLSSNGCGHYTQLVWKNTRQVGCGYSTCTDSDDFLIEVWVCNYDPPGNVIGQTPY